MNAFVTGYARMYADQSEIFSQPVVRPAKRNKSTAGPWANSPVVTPAFSNIVIRVDMASPGTGPAWLLTTIQRIASLSELQANWDGYGAARISEKAIERALNYVAALADHEEMAPTVVPLVRGAVQLEWSTPNGDFEVVLAQDGPALVFRENVDELEQEMDDPSSRKAAIAWVLHEPADAQTR